jgi:nucleoside-diphosphate-sugar epimerase
MGSLEKQEISILITGAGGFLGQELAAALLDAEPTAHLILADVVRPKASFLQHAKRITIIEADLTSSEAVTSLLQPKLSACYLLHGIMSGGAEANLDLGLKVNLDSFRLILDNLRKSQPAVKVIFPSSLAIYGPSQPGQVTNEKTIPMPQSSYGAEKLIVETLINDFSRRGLIDGRICRLPTVIVRPGAPSAAASSFASGIVRESLKGERNILPVGQDLEMWVASPRTVVKNLVAIKDVPQTKFGAPQGRAVNLPGQTVTVRQILEALEEIGGKEKRNLVEEIKDANIEAIVGSWPARFDTSLARKLGMSEDVTLKDEVEFFAKTLVS